MRFLITPALLAVLVAGCTAEITGSGSRSGTASPTSDETSTRETSKTTRPPTTTTTTTTTAGGVTALNGVPPEQYEGLPSQFCDRPFTGALGKPMLAVVVETPKGRLNCDQAAAVLVDYYAERSEPKAGLPPVVIGPMSCNQVAEGLLPQVVCADADNLIYSMWPQT
ncbi:hypothetical protein SAMN05216188_106101 [Lentzea xinjiangensis]|uniref:Subtilisin inhibitor-like n=1 Tax=Lentzea xinjiangensis TaxID=402600 RepID=A0A1H9JQC3_9PSEU|nr:hypothetical protein [Lentzea xinjiangensis]SEQ89026.1 hypothetical protein SAMN05216188_106101 [Lentzea xinjiangensis]